MNSLETLIPARLNPAQLADEAAMWLARLDLETADLAAFELWRGQSPDHAVAFARAHAAWEVAGRVHSPA
jgi:ferric-dicitrate binding protein FerR (iron transport regulator)